MTQQLEQGNSFNDALEQFLDRPLEWARMDDFQAQFVNVVEEVLDEQP